MCRQNRYDNPTSWEERRGRTPTFASRDKWVRIEASQRNRICLEAYRAAHDAFIGGLRDAVFSEARRAQTRFPPRESVA